MAARSGLNYVSLFSGVGALGLGVELALPGSRCVLHIEREIFAVAVLVARMQEDSLDDSPIWSDVSTADYGPWRGD